MNIELTIPRLHFWFPDYCESNPGTRSEVPNYCESNPGTRSEVLEL